MSYFLQPSDHSCRACARIQRLGVLESDRNRETNIISRNGPVVASYVASEDDQIMLVTNSGKLIRIRVHGGEGDSIRVAGRKTQGVRLFDVDEGEKVVSVAIVREDENENSDTAEFRKINDGDTLLSDKNVDKIPGKTGED